LDWRVELLNRPAAWRGGRRRDSDEDIPRGRNATWRCIIGANRQPLPSPPAGLLDRASLFLDLDGTLLELIDQPAEVSADAELRELITALGTRLEGRLAIVSGRSLAQIDGILGEVAAELAVSGSHGCEHRWRGVAARPNRPHTLDLAAEKIRPLADRHSGVLVEEKSFGVAIHYRMAPAAEHEAHTLAGALAGELDLFLQPGNMMVELRVAGGDKGRAIHRLMERPPMRGTTPVFIGDDLTDEPGFVAARGLGGHGIMVGPPRPTAADYGIGCPADLRAWLAEAIR
jgi:trehalose 6-phosphate phosphatase